MTARPGGGAARLDRLRDFCHDLAGTGDRTSTLARGRVWLALVVLVVGSLASLARTPRASWDTLWAEDGTIFIAGAYAGDSPLRTYAGYLHVVPRIVASLVTAFVPVGTLATTVTIVAAVLTGGVAAAVFVFASQRMRSRVLPLLVAAQVVVLPSAGAEVLNSIANTQWYLIALAFWATVVAPKSTGGRVLQWSALALAVLSDPFAAFVAAPLIVARVIAIGVRSTDAVVAWVFLAASLVQGAFTFHGIVLQPSRTPSTSSPSLWEVVEALAGRVVVDSLIGNSATVALYAVGGVVVTIVGLLVLIGIMVLGSRLASGTIAVALAGTLLSIIYFVVIIVFQWDPVLATTPGAVLPTGRYTVPAILLLVASYAFIAEGIRSRTVRIIATILVGATVIIPGAIDYRIVDIRAGAPDWGQVVDEGAEACRRDQGLPFVEIPSAPVGWPGVPVPCAAVRER